MRHHRPDVPTIRAVFLFPNGMVAVTDHQGQQVPDLQGPLADVRVALRDALAMQPVPVQYHGCTSATFGVPA